MLVQYRICCVENQTPQRPTLTGLRGSCKVIKPIQIGHFFRQFRINKRKKTLIFISLLLLIFSQTVTAWAIVGDRLILSINNIPFSQLQIEALMNVKETLRADPNQSQIVDQSNWALALSAFITDMTEYLEASKTSGYRPQRELVLKTTERVKLALQSSPKFKSRFAALGLDDAAIREQVTRILTIENLRRSRQGAIGAKDSQAPGVWQDELMRNTMIRWFDNGKTYEHIQPK